MKEKYSKEVINELLLRMKSNAYDKNAADVLYSRLKISVYFVAKKYLTNSLNREYDAEDIVGATFEAVFKKIDSFRVAKNGSAWIFKITENLCKKLMKKQQREVLTCDVNMECAKNMECASDFKYSEMNKMQLGKILRNLTDEEKAIIVLHTINELTFKEIAGILNISVSTVVGRIRSIMERYHQDNCLEK